MILDIGGFAAVFFGLILITIAAIWYSIKLIREDKKFGWLIIAIFTAIILYIFLRWWPK